MTAGLDPGRETDLAILRLGGSQVEEHADHLVVRTPRVPTFHWGSYVVVTDPATADDAERWHRLHTEAHPDARHLAVGLPTEPSPQGRAAWERLGAEVDADTVLITDRPPQAPRPLPAGYEIRPITGDDEWQQHVRLSLTDASGDPAAYEVFRRQRAVVLRELVEREHAWWPGAFTSDGELTADLGIVLCPGGTARYQDVITHPQHRRRGLAARLLQAAGEWAHQHGAHRWVIVAEAGGDPERLYRSVGFDTHSQVFSAYRAS